MCDIQSKMLELLKERAAKAITNIETILGEYEDPKLPKTQVDLIFALDAYHEFQTAEIIGKNA